MTSLLVTLLVVLNPMHVHAPMAQFDLPKTWTKDFTITYSYSGSMDGSRTDLKMTYDSCRYTVQQGMTAPKTGAFLMTEAGRAEILKKMHDLKVNTIKSEPSMHPVNDGHAETLCFGTRCISGGTGAIMNEKDRDIFSAAHAYLADFAGKQSKKQPR